MRKNVSPLTAGMLAVALLGIVLYFLGRSGPHVTPIKPADALRNPAMRDAIRERFRRSQGAGGH